MSGRQLGMFDRVHSSEVACDSMTIFSTRRSRTRERRAGGCGADLGALLMRPRHRRPGAAWSGGIRLFDPSFDFDERDLQMTVDAALEDVARGMRHDMRTQKH